MLFLLCWLTSCFCVFTRAIFLMSQLQSQWNTLRDIIIVNQGNSFTSLLLTFKKILFITYHCQLGKRLEGHYCFQSTFYFKILVSIMVLFEIELIHVTFNIIFKKVRWWQIINQILIVFFWPWSNYNLISHIGNVGGKSYPILRWWFLLFVWS